MCAIKVSRREWLNKDQKSKMYKAMCIKPRDVRDRVMKNGRVRDDDDAVDLTRHHESCAQLVPWTMLSFLMPCML